MLDYGTDSWGQWSKHVLIELQNLRNENIALRESQAKALKEMTEQHRLEMEALRQQHQDEITGLRRDYNTVNTSLATLQTEFRLKAGIFGIVGGMLTTGATLVIGLVLSKLKGL